jgi:hypothetical protein
MNAQHPRIPRNRESILPRWIGLPPLLRIAIGVAIGLLALSAVWSVA